MRVSDAWLRLRRASLEPGFWLQVGSGVVVLLCLSQLLLFGFGRDQSIYAVVGEGLLNGEMPYRDRWDFKPPGIFLVFALAEGVFGQAMWGVRVLESLGLLVMCWSMVRLSRVFFGGDSPGYLAAALASLLHVQMEFWHTAQPESFGGFLTVFGLWLATLQCGERRRQLLIWLACGAVFGVAFLFKPPLGGGAVVCAAYLARQRLEQASEWRAAVVPFVAVGVGSLIPILLCGVSFVAAGAWDALSWTLFEFTPGYTKLGWGKDGAGAFYLAVSYAFTKYSALTAIGAVAAGIGAPVASREREGLALVLGVIALHLAGIAMQAKFFEYHFNATLPLVSILAGVGWFKIWRKAAMHRLAGGLAFVSLVFVVGSARVAVYDVPHGFWERCVRRAEYLLGMGDLETREELDRDLYYVADYNLAADRDVARRVEELTPPGAPIYVWGFEPLIYWLSQRAPASRFIYNVPQRARWEKERAREDLLRDLEQRPPAMFIVQHNDYFRFVTGDDLDSYRALETFPELQRMLDRDFRHVEKLEDFELYVRREHSLVGRVDEVNESM